MCVLIRLANVCVIILLSKVYELILLANVYVLIHNHTILLSLLLGGHPQCICVNVCQQIMFLIYIYYAID